MAYDFGIGSSGPLGGEQLHRMGLYYSIGHGAAIDLVEAHKFFNLAALRGHPPSKLYRKELAEQMTSAQIAQAQRAAREWLQRAA
ncbi:MAG: hypothetical protein K2P95_04530 [Hyphomonadaceae bacterium]|nr:hypothetical protein [Hyphomonadaceae bacterium]